MERIVQEMFETLLSSLMSYQPHTQGGLLKRAFEFAQKAHSAHTRKSGEPYIVHPLQAALHLTKIQADEVTIAGAILHDVFDNKEVTLSMLQKEFGNEVAKIVLGVHNLGKLYYRVDMTPVEIDILKKNLVSAGEDIRIFLIKIAERFHNLQTLQYLPQSKRYRIAKESEQIYLPILNFLSIGEFMSEFNELCFQYVDEKQYKKLQKEFGKNKEKYEKIIIGAYEKIKIQIDQTNIKYTIQSRVKSLHSIYKKIIGSHIEMENIYDFLALRVICDSVDDCYLVLGKIHQTFSLKEEKFKDYISMPKENGYQAIHSTVYDSNENMLEFQILTKEMHALNQTGLAAHFMYKGFGIDQSQLPDWMQSVLDIQKKSLNSSAFLSRLREEVLISDMRCYDQDGGAVVLPKEATLIDFAFQKSEFAGIHFHGAYVNQTFISEPTHRLENGDKVQLLLGDEKYLKYKIEHFDAIKTSAKLSIIQLMGRYKKPFLIELGRYQLNQTLEDYSGKDFALLPEHIQQQILKENDLYDHDALYHDIAVQKIHLQKIVDDIHKYSKLSDFSHEVSFKIFLKYSDAKTLENISKMSEKLGSVLKEVKFFKKRNIVYLTLFLRSSQLYQEYVGELQRQPNVAEVVRIFPAKLKMYCAVLTGTSACIGIGSMILQTLHQTFLLLLFSLLLLLLLGMMRQITKKVFHYFYRIKRGLYFIFVVNSFAFLAIFFGFIGAGFHHSSLVGFSLLSFVFYFFLFYNLFSTYGLYYRNK